MADPVTLSAILASAVVALAQDPAPAPDPVARFVAADTAFVLRLDGPARMRASFLATNVGTMLEAQEAGDLWDALGEPLRRVLRVLGDEAGVGLSGAITELRPYRGRITIAIDLTPHEQAWAGVPPDAAGVLVMAPDGGQALAQFAQRVGEALGRSKLAERALTTKDGEERAFWFNAHDGLTAPRFVDGHLVMFFGEQLARAVERMHAARDGASWQPAEGEREAPLSLVVDAQKLLRTALANESWAGGFVKPEKLADVLGLTALRDVRAELRPSGPHLRLEASLGFAGGPRGLFSMFFPDSPEPPGLVALVPPGTRYWQACKLDPAALHETVVRSVGLFMNGDASGDKVRKRLVDHYGFDSGVDMLGLLTRDCVVIGRVFGSSPRAPASEELSPTELGAGGDTVAFAFAVREPAKFAERWRKVLEIDGERRGETRSVAGVDVHHTGFVFWDLSWAIDRDLFYLAIGDAAPEWLEAFVQHSRTLARDDFGKAPIEITRLQRDAPPGWHGCGGFDVEHLMTLDWWTWFDLAGDVEGELRELGRAVIGALQPKLAGHRLVRAVVLSGYSDSRWRCRVLW